MNLSKRPYRVVGPLGVLALIGITLLGACSKPDPGPKPLGPVQAPGYLPPDVLARSVDFRGSCSWGRAPGDPAVYRTRLRARSTSSGTVQVRSSAEFDPLDTSNLLGELPSGTTVLADGPVYDSRNQVKGWALLVRGTSGRVCRGYVTEASMTPDPGR